MKENVTYGECLAEILKALDIKCSKLAREINIDSSLVYKWLRNERVPPYDSLYIDLILNFLSKKMINPFQKKSIIEFLENNEIELPDASDAHILKNLRRMLEHSQGYSIKLHNIKKSENRLSTDGAPYTPAIFTGQPARSNSFCSNYDNVQIVKGGREVICTALDLITRAPDKPIANDSAILITLNNDLRSQLLTRDLYNVCLEKLHELLSNGWKCILHIMLDGNPDRTIKVIEGIQSLITTGNLMIYYYSRKSHEHTKETELCIIPQTGALLGLSTSMNDQIDSAFLFHSKNSLEILTTSFFSSLNSSKPLLKPCPSQKSTEFQNAFAEFEEAPGEKCVFKGGLSTVTIPLNLYEKYLLCGNITSQELSHRKYLHKRRLDAFQEHIKYYKFRDICFTEAVVDLVDNRNYSFDENYLVQNHIPQNLDIVSHLEHLTCLLETYENYNVAFVSKAHFLGVKNINWMVKKGSCVLIETYQDNCMDYFDPDINCLISEKSTVNAFFDHFNNLWSSISNENKDKKNTIPWLKSLTERCREKSSPDWPSGHGNL